MTTRLARTTFAIAALALAATGSARAAETLVDAIKSGDRAAAMAMIGHADVNKPESNGTTPLIWAVHKDDVELVDRLIKNHANVSATNNYGASALSEAAILGNVDILEKLLKAGAHVDFPNADGQTALMIIARTANVEAAKVLLRHGADVNKREKWLGQTALMWAAAQSHPEMVKLLIKHGAKVEARSVVHDWNRPITAEQRAKQLPRGGLTPLLFAAREGCLGCVQALVEAKADVNMTDPDGVSPLLIALLNAHFDVGKYLLAKGANPNKWDWWGRNPLYAAVDYNTLPHGGRPDLPSLDETTGIEMIKLLLDAGANPNLQLKLLQPYRALGADRGADGILNIGTTSLLRAARAGDLPAMKLLLAHGALVNLPTQRGVTPLMAAAGLGGSKIDTRGRYITEPQALAAVQLLLDHGADVNAADGSGQTALHGAAFRGWNDVIKLLVKHDAKVVVADDKGQTPLDAAMGRIHRRARLGTTEVHKETGALLEKLAAEQQL
jgi:ankyrin repeat protein